MTCPKVSILRCFQIYSLVAWLPNGADWIHNWYTIGYSPLILSYKEDFRIKYPKVVRSEYTYCLTTY